MRCLAPLFVAALAAPLFARETHVVSDVAGLLFELGTADPDDLILMEPGSYDFVLPDQLRIDRPLRLAARHAGTVHVRTEFGAVVQNLQAGEFVSIDGLEFELLGFPFNGTGAGLTVRNGDGLVFLSRCDVRGELIDFSVTPPVGHPGLRVEQALVSAVDCSFRGSGGLVPSFAYPPGPGILLDGGQLLLDGCESVGRDGASAEFTPPIDATPGGVGLLAFGGRVVATDSVFQSGAGGDGIEFVPNFCLEPAAGGHGIEAGGPAPTALELYGCTLLPGVGGIKPGCGGGSAPAGQPIAGPGALASEISVSSFPLGLSAPSTALSGSLALVVLQGVEFASPKFLAVSGGAALSAAVGFEGLPILVQSPLNLVPLPYGGAQAFSLPTLAPGEHLGLVLQGLELPSNGVALVHPARFLGVY